MLATTLACSLLAMPAQAQRARVFVASYGVDGNPCTFGSPCKTFQYAVNAVADQGEVTAIDSAGFGQVTITNKSVTITSPDGVEAGIAIPSGGTGIAVYGGTSDLITLRGLVLDGAGVGQTGIAFNSGRALAIQKCVVRNLTQDGIDFNVNVSSGFTSSLHVSDTFVSYNGGSGISVQPGGSGTAAAVFERVESDLNFVNGFVVSGSASTGIVIATANDSVAAGNGQVGFIAVGNATNSSINTFDVFRSTSSNNNTGLKTDGNNSFMTIGQSVITGNSNGWLSTGGLLSSSMTSMMAGNAFDQSEPTIGGAW